MISRNIALLLLIPMLALTAPAIDAADAATAAGPVLSKAQQSFNEGLAQLEEGDADAARAAFTEAAAVYQSLAADFTNPALAYNIGSSYLRAGATGPAVLWLLRAQLRGGLPNGQVERNLQVAREQINFAAPPAETQTLLGQAGRLLSFFGPQTWLWLAIATFAAGWLLLTIRHFQRSWAPPTAIAAAWAITLVAAFACLSTAQWRSGGPATVIVGKPVMVMSGPSTGGYEPIFATPAPPGVEVTLIEQRDNWTMVKFGNGRQGWIPTSALQKL